MTNVEAMRLLQDAASYLLGQERNLSINMAEHIIEDRILWLWNDPNTNRAEYWQ